MHFFRFLAYICWKLKVNSMEAMFKAESPYEIKRIAKSYDMTNFIFDLVHNAKKRVQAQNENIDYTPFAEVVRDLLTEHNIDIDDLIGEYW